MLSLKSIGLAVTHYRWKAGLTPKQLAARLFITHVALGEIENGSREMDIIQLKDLCCILKVSLSRFFRTADGQAALRLV